MSWHYEGSYTVATGISHHLYNTHHNVFMNSQALRSADVFWFGVFIALPEGTRPRVESNARKSFCRCQRKRTTNYIGGATRHSGWESLRCAMVVDQRNPHLSFRYGILVPQVPTHGTWKTAGLLWVPSIAGLLWGSRHDG